MRFGGTRDTTRNVTRVVPAEALTRTAGSVKARATPLPGGMTAAMVWSFPTRAGGDAVLGCGSAAVTKRPERTAKGYRRFQCRTCGGKQFNERAGSLLNRRSTRATHRSRCALALALQTLG
jgi:hypothetical protein